MQYRKFAFFTVVLMALVSLWSCEYEKIEPIPAPPITDTVSYSLQIQPIWDKSCLGGGCHGSGANQPDLSPSNSYNSLISGGYIILYDPDDSKLYKEIEPGGQMNPYTNANDINLVLVWIQQGAKNN
jgi:hypothetical protein